MPDPVKLIAKRLTAMTYQIIDGQQQFFWGTVLSRNPDGTINVDDGKGGCVLVLPPNNARTGERGLFSLGDVGGIGMPGVLSLSASLPQVNHVPPLAFIDNTGRTFGSTGALTGSGGTPTADVDASFGYSFSDPNNFAGVSPSYADLQIGVAAVSGYQGETYSANNTVLCQGIGASAGILLGIEIDNTLPGLDVWTVQLRDASTFAILATNAATYISDWMTAHSADYFGNNTDWDVHVSADPFDGSFWINLGGNVGPTSAPMFNVDPADGSLIRTITIDLSADHFNFKRVHRVST